MNEKKVHGYKVFNPDWTCSPEGNTKQYTCPGKFEEDIDPIRCRRGMHFCKKAADLFHYAVIMAIPNFDKGIFKEITGIDVEAAG